VSRASVPAVGEPLADFSLADLEGRTWTRSHLLGERVVLFCFASW
jgi:peroxiredoxin